MPEPSEDQTHQDASSSSVEDATPNKKGTNTTTFTLEQSSKQEFEDKYQQLKGLRAGGQGWVYANYQSQ